MKSINMRELLKALEQLEKEEGISKEYLKEALVTALEAAYKENYNEEDEVKIELTKEGSIMVYADRLVVEDVKDEAKEVTLEMAKKFKKSAKIGDTVKVVVVPKDFGRIAVQKGKQIIVQKLREKEKEVRFAEYESKKGEVITGIVQKADGKTVILDLGKLEGIMPLTEQVETENYHVNQKLRVFVKDVLRREKGDVQVLVSRKDAGFVKRLFEYEIPEIDEGLIEIKAVSRDAGKRAKVAVYSKNENIDPVGSCVGPKGLRIENIRRELLGEKIDVVEWSEDPSKFIAGALLPAEIMAVDIDEENHFAQVIVADDQLSLAIGKRGQNARLAVELTTWKIDIKSITEYREILTKGSEEASEEVKTVIEEEEKQRGTEEIFEEVEIEISEEEAIENELKELQILKEEENEETENN